jgi:hypothetical protein
MFTEPPATAFRGWAMRCAVSNLALATVIAFTMSAERVRAQAQPDSSQVTKSPFVTTNRVLEASLARIFRGSALWREAAEAVRRTGRYALLVTPTDPLMSNIAKGNRDAFDPDQLAEVIPLLREDSQVGLVLVFVNLPLLKEIHDAKLSVPRDFDADLDRILVHEIYGHSVPYLLAGNLSGRCADPQPGERPSEACSIRRENTVRAELGLGRRVDAGLSSLTLAWGR